MGRKQHLYEQFESGRTTAGALTFQRANSSGTTIFSLSNLTPEQGARIREVILRVKAAGVGASTDTYVIRELTGSLALIPVTTIANTTAGATIIRIPGPAASGTGSAASGPARDLDMLITHGSACTTGIQLHMAIFWQM